jgi:hypothetical protein
MAKGDNQTQVVSGLEPTDIAWLNEQNSGMGQRLNHVLSSLGNVLGAAAGHRGTVQLVKQKGKNAKGLVDATLDASEGRIASVQDPVLDLDAVNLRTARRLFFVEKQRREEGDDEVIRSIHPVAAGIPADYFMVPKLNAITQIGTLLFNIANQVNCQRFYLAGGITVTAIVWELTQANAGKFLYFGIYNADGTELLINSGQQSATVPAVKTFTLSTSVELPPGMYIWASGCDDVGVAAFRCATAFGATVLGILNKNVVHQGKATNNISSGALPATLGTLITSDVVLLAAKIEGTA